MLAWYFINLFIYHNVFVFVLDLMYMYLYLVNIAVIAVLVLVFVLDEVYFTRALTMHISAVKLAGQ